MTSDVVLPNFDLEMEAPKTVNNQIIKVSNVLKKLKLRPYIQDCYVLEVQNVMQKLKNIKIENEEYPNVNNIFNVLLLSTHNNPTFGKFYVIDLMKRYKIGDIIPRAYFIKLTKEELITVNSIQLRFDMEQMTKRLKSKSANADEYTEENLYKLIPPFTEDDINELILQLYSNDLTWKDLIDFYITEGLPKIEKLVEYFRSIIIPLKEITIESKRGNIFPNIKEIEEQETAKRKFDIFEDVKQNMPLSKLMSWQNHALICLPGGTSKSTTAGHLLGSTVQSGRYLTEKFFLGDNTQNGVLEGSGIFAADEIDLGEAKEKEIVSKLMKVLETGSSLRGIGGMKTCYSTKTVVLMGNLRKEKIIARSNIQRKIGVLAEDVLLLLAGITDKEKSNSFPDFEAFGNRFGTIMLSLYEPNLRELKTEFESYYSLINDILESIIQIKYGQIFSAFIHFSEWIENINNEVKEELITKLKDIQETPVKRFIKGCVINQKRQRCSAIRSAIVDNLDKLFVSDSLKEFYCSINNTKENYLAKLININEQTIIKCSGKEYPVELVKTLMDLKQKGETLRNIERTMGIPRATLQRLFKEMESDEI